MTPVPPLIKLHHFSPPLCWFYHAPHQHGYCPARFLSTDNIRYNLQSKLAFVDSLFAKLDTASFTLKGMYYAHRFLLSHPGDSANQRSCSSQGRNASSDVRSLGQPIWKS